MLVKNYAGVLTPANLEPVLLGLPPLITESDLHIAQLNMSLLSSVARLQKGALPTVTETSLPEIFKLAQSPLLQGKITNLTPDPRSRLSLDFRVLVIPVYY